MVNTDIFLGSGASITKIPELDIYFPISTGAGSDISTITASTAFQADFSLVNDLYVGCVIKRYNSSNVLQNSHRIKSNTATTITFTPATTIASGDYFVIDNYGAPCPAPKVAGGGSVHTHAITTITFNSDLLADYNDDAVVFQVLETNGGIGGDSVVSFDTTGSQTYSGGVTPAQVADISAQNTREEYATVFAASVNALVKISATRNGAVVTVTNQYPGTTTATVLTELDGTAGTNTGVTIANTLGTTTTAAGIKKLLADTWLGITESVTFPTTEVEMKQSNLSLGGSRNWTYQYKGIETAGAAEVNLIAHHGSWLYYFFGKCTGVSIADNVPSGTPPTFDNAESSNAVYIDYGSVTETGPIFHRSVGTVMTPYVNPATETVGNLDKITSAPVQSGTAIQNAIKYTFAEQEGDLLPSFALEQTFSKLVGSDPYQTATSSDNPNNRNDEDLNFVKIARGCRVNTLTMTANENEEVKMNISANTRNVHSLEKDEAYEARNGVEDENSFFNFTSVDAFREPFFFSDGTFKIFGETFLKINTLTLTMNNTLVDRRFLGVGNKRVQEAIPSQREYEIQFTGHVTDDLLYNELINDTENKTQTIELVFTKSNGEEIKLNFSNYFLSANNFPISEDKGAIVVEGTVKPRTCSLCEVNTHWQLQG